MVSQSGTDTSFPPIIFRWIAAALPEEDVNFSRGEITRFALEKGLVKVEDERKLFLRLGRVMNNGFLDLENPAIVYIDEMTPTEAYPTSQWKQACVKAACRQGGATQLQFFFLVERATDGLLHHPNSLAHLLKREDLAIHRLKGSLARERERAKLSFQNLKRRLITVDPQGTRSDLTQDDREIPSKLLPSWTSEIWKSAAKVPGYYGLHQQSVDGNEDNEETRVKPNPEQESETEGL